VSIIGIKINREYKPLLIVNVYLRYWSSDNLESFKYNDSSPYFIGDFHASAFNIFVPILLEFQIKIFQNRISNFFPLHPAFDNCDTGTDKKLIKKYSILINMLSLSFVDS